MGDEVLRLDRSVVEWRVVEDEVVALDLRDSMYLGINPTGAVLWSALAEGTTRSELLERLTATFDVDRERAREDLDAFLASLDERDLLERTEPA